MASKILIIGVGNRMRGDDGAGPLAIDKLKKSSTIPKAWLLMDAAEVPENALGLVDKEKPDHVLLIDACDWGAEPGSVRFFSADELEKLPIRMLSTHGIPLSFWVKMTLSEHPELKIEMLGIQAQSLEFNSTLTSPVIKVLEIIQGIITDHLC